MSIDAKLYPRISKAFALTGAKPPDFLAEKFARILQKIELFWGEKEADDYFSSLMLGEDRNESGSPMQRKDISGPSANTIRGPVRQGFPPEAVLEIARLKKVHDYLFPAATGIDPFYGSQSNKGR
jgi:hypothetical protein